MKKILSLILATIMAFTIMVPAFTVSAETLNGYSASDSVKTEVQADNSSGNFFQAIIDFFRSIFYSKITFDTDGGSEIDDYYKLKFSRIAPPADPTKEGYSFVGWEPEIPDRMPWRNLSVKAKWDIHHHNVYWVIDGEIAKTESYAYGDKIIRYTPVEKEGYTLSPWSIMPDTMPDEDITINAAYSINEYKTTWIVDGIKEVAYCQYNALISIPSEPQKTGHTFKEWSPSVPEKMPANDLTFTAIFEVNSYSATFNSTQGTFSDGSTSKRIITKYGEEISFDQIPVREGYDFAGWDKVIPDTMPSEDLIFNAKWVAKTDIKYTVNLYTMDTNGVYGNAQKVVCSGTTDKTATYYPEQIKGFYVDSSSTLSTVVKADGSAEINVYYAREKYNVKFVYDNGEDDFSKDYYYGSTITVPEDPQKDGYTFMGWEPEVSQTVSGNLIYKAQWEKYTEIVIAESDEEFSSKVMELVNESLNDENFDKDAALEDEFYMSRVIANCSDFSSIDFSMFNADTIVMNDDGTVILQFANRDLAEECSDYLNGLSSVTFAEADAYIESPEEVEIESIPDMSNSIWGEKYINADKYAYYLENNNFNDLLTVAVIDTGIDTDHPYFNGRLTGGRNCFDGSSYPEDDSGHGTHVSGVVVNCTNNLNVKIMPIKSLNAEGGTLNSIVSGINYAVSQRVQVINLSLESPYGRHSKYLEEAIENAVSKGIIVVVAAGNGEKITHNPVDTANVSPANMDNVIVVGALDETGTKGTFSNFGESVDVIAPGVNVPSTYLDGKYALMSGTSQAAPHISAVAAMFKLSHPDYTPAQIEAMIKQYCVDKGPAGRDDFYGEGCPDMYNAIPDCTVSFNSNGGSYVNSATTKNSSSVILPKPEKSYKVTFDANGGTLSQYSCFSSCTFDGWYKTASLSDERLIDGESYMLLKDQTLYAKWINNRTDIASYRPTRNGYKFVGWFTSPSSGVEYTNASVISDNITLYAHWYQYTVYYNANGGYGEPSAQKWYGTTTISTSIPYRSGYDFLGWGVGQGSTVSYYPGNSINVYEDITLIAVWKESKVSVPYVIGQSYSSALSTLKNSGLSVSVNYAYNYNVAANVIYGQSISSGTLVEKGTNITLNCSLGAKPFAVGDYVWFDGGTVWRSLGGSSVTKPSSYEVGELIITDNAYYYNGKTYYGIKFQGGSGRFGWVEESIIHQRTN